MVSQCIAHLMKIRKEPNTRRSTLRNLEGRQLQATHAIPDIAFDFRISNTCAYSYLDPDKICLLMLFNG